MYGWAGPLIDAVPDDPGYPVAGLDYDPALLGAPAVFPTPAGSDLDRWLDWHAGKATLARVNQSQTGTQWLNLNAGKVALGVGGLFLVVMLAKAGR